MPKPTSSKPSGASKKTRLNLKLRATLGEAYAVVMGARYNEQISAVTLEVVMQEQINIIEGTDGITAIRPNKLDEVARILEETTTAIDQVKKKHPSDFAVDIDDRAADTNVNTPETPNG